MNWFVDVLRTLKDLICPNDCWWLSVILFSKLNKIFLGYFYPDIFFPTIEIINVRGDLTDVSVKTATLVDMDDVSTLLSMR